MCGRRRAFNDQLHAFRVGESRMLTWYSHQMNEWSQFETIDDNFAYFEFNAADASGLMKEGAVYRVVQMDANDENQTLIE